MARKFRPELQMKLLNEIFATSFFLQSFTKFKCCLYEWSVRRAWYTFKITFPFYQAETVTHVRRCVLTLICLCLYFFNYTTAFYLSEPRPSLPLCTLPRLPPWRRSSPGRGRRSCCGQRTSNRRYLKGISMNSSFYALYHTVSTNIIVQYMKYIFFYKASP